MSTPSPRALAALLVSVFVSLGSVACNTEDLDDAGARVVASRNAPDANCRSIGTFTGRGGGSFGGGFVSNDSLMQYALNDLRNEVGEAGGNYVQHDPIVLSQESGKTTSTATVSGTGYACPNANP
ncbi:MAG: DUF4156 domain-containing protein [Deltaproteobacteria bacterium]|nr:DUF4156 domain-containing protein [Deltaproteobacteria bacterium]